MMMMIAVASLAVLLVQQQECAAFSLSSSSFASPPRTGRSSRLHLTALVEHHDLLQNALSGLTAHDLHHHASSLLLSLSDGGAGEGADAAAAAAKALPPAEVSRYSTVDKTGFIGNIANYIEQAIDLGHTTLQGTGLKNTYGFSIILFTLLVKAITFPLTKSQIESTVKMQQLTPMQDKIKSRFPDKADEQKRNQMLSQLFQAANVNPLAGCLPALAQIPIFISLYRALQNLVAENKLDEPFLWIPDLEGPTYALPPSQSMDWIKSVFSGNPSLGWHDTVAFLSLPFILFISQTLSQRVLQPPKDKNKVLTEAEEISQSVIKNLPFIVAAFSINVPAGLAVYWIINNVMTTLITVITKKVIVPEPVTAEVSKMMAMLEAGPGKMSMSRSNRGTGKEELRTGVMSKKVEKKEGFSGTSSTSAMSMDEAAGAAMGSSAEGSVVAADLSALSSSSSSSSSSADEDDEVEDDDTQKSEGGEKKRKKRVKPASQKSSKNRR